MSSRRHRNNRDERRDERRRGGAASSQQQLPAGAVMRPIPPQTQGGAMVGAPQTYSAIPYGTYGPGSASASMALTGANSIPVSAVQQDMQAPLVFPPGNPIRPTPGLGDGWGGPRQFAYPSGINITPQPRATEQVSFVMLRNLAALYEGIQLCEAVIFRILDRLELQIVPSPDLIGPDDDPTSDQWAKPARAMRDWLLEGPDRRQDLHSWMKAIMRDLLELDAIALYHRPTRSGGLYALEPVAGDTISCLVDAAGRVPLAPYPAFLQVLYGVPAGWYGVGEMDYLRFTARTDSLYGLPPSERVIMRVNQALRKESYDLARFTAGSTPEGVIQTSDAQIARQMTVEKAQQWEEMFNAVLAGNDTMRVRAKMVAPGWTFTSTRQQDIATEFDAYLLNVTVGAFGLTKDELGFTDTSNRSVGASQENVTYRNAVKPNTDFIARYLTRVIRRYNGQPLAPNAATISRAAAATKPAKGVWDARFLVTWGGIEEPEDFGAKAQAATALVNAGVMGRTEAKRWLKLPAQKDDVVSPPMITVQGGATSVVILEDFLAQRDQMKDAASAQIAAQIAGAKAAATLHPQGPDATQMPPGGPAAPNQPQQGPQGHAQSQQGESTSASDDAHAQQGDNSNNDETNDDDQEDSSDGERARRDTRQRVGRGALAAAVDTAAAERWQSERERRDGLGNGDGDDYPARAQHSSGAASSAARERTAGGLAWDGVRRLGGRTDPSGGALGDGRASEADTAAQGVSGEGRASASASRTNGDGRGVSGDTSRTASGAGAASSITPPPSVDSGVMTERRELLNWREKALSALKRGRAAPLFTPVALAATTHAAVAAALSRVTTAEEARAVFSAWLATLDPPQPAERESSEQQAQRDEQQAQRGAAPSEWAAALLELREQRAMVLAALEP